MHSFDGSFHFQDESILDPFIATLSCGLIQKLQSSLTVWSESHQTAQLFLIVSLEKAKSDPGLIGFTAVTKSNRLDLITTIVLA
jgi:hypothetical protein